MHSEDNEYIPPISLDATTSLGFQHYLFCLHVKGRNQMRKKRITNIIIVLSKPYTDVNQHSM